jgi:hypothetical protein
MHPSGLASSHGAGCEEEGQEEVRCTEMVDNSQKLMTACQLV